MKGVLRARARPDATCREGGRSDAVPFFLWSFAFVFFKYLLLYAIILSCMCFKALMFVYKIAVCN